MELYALVQDIETGQCCVAIGNDIDFYIKNGFTLQDVKQSDINGEWYIADKCPMKSDEQKEQEEKERILNLKCTKRVLALCLQQFGISYTQLKELIATNEQAQLEWDLCVELERSNPLLDIMGKQLNITPEQIDNIFKFANGEIESLEV